jgi:hypothetical protein
MQRPTDIEVADAIIARATEPYGNEAYIRASKLISFSRSIVWRNSITSEVGAGRVWKKLEGDMFQMEWIIEMVNEYVYLIGLTNLQQDVAKRQAEALAWLKNAQGIPTENKQMSNTAEEIQQGLAKNPLLMFLYSLSLGQYNKRLADLGIERILAGQKPKAPKVNG